MTSVYRVPGWTPYQVADYGDELRAAAADGPWVYFARSGPQEVKIGFTTDILHRMRVLRSTSRFPVKVLAVVQADYAYEQAVHRRLKSSLAKGREYYRPTKTVLDIIDIERSYCGLPPLPRGQKAA